MALTPAVLPRRSIRACLLSARVHVRTIGAFVCALLAPLWNEGGRLEGRGACAGGRTYLIQDTKTGQHLRATVSDATDHLTRRTQKVCTGTRLTPATSAPRLGSTLPHLCQDQAHRLR